MRIDLPEEVKLIIKRLEIAGYEAFAVGGCIRDSLMGKVPKDWDITTNALPGTIKEIFRATVDTGIKHGTVTVLIHGNAYEVTTYRIDGTYSDGRHPDEVAYTSDLQEDLKRRDFRMNAMAYNESVGFVDPFGGVNDIENKQINCVGVATERFTEDALRILRAFRFSARLGFEIGEETKKAAISLKERLALVSYERIRDELNKIMLSSHPEVILEISRLGIFSNCLEEFEIKKNNILLFDEGNVGLLNEKKPKLNPSCLMLQESEETTILPNNIVKNCDNREDKINLYLNAVSFVEPNQAIRWAIWLLGLMSVKKNIDPVYILRKLRFDNNTIRIVKYIISFIEFDESELNPNKARLFLHETKEREIANAIMQARLALQKCVFSCDEKVELLSKISKVHEQIYDNKDCLFIKDLALNGKDLIELGYKQGEILGKILDELLEEVLKKPELNTREDLLEYLKSGGCV